MSIWNVFKKKTKVVETNNESNHIDNNVKHKSIKDELLFDGNEGIIHIQYDYRNEVKHISETPEIFDTSKYNSWGSSVNVDSYYEAHGHLTPIPRRGDLILQTMKSGRKCFFVIKYVRQCDNPSDMFFADIHPIGYLIDTEENLKKLMMIEIKTAANI